MRIDWLRVLDTMVGIASILGIAATAWKDYHEGEASRMKARLDKDSNLAR